MRHLGVELPHFEELLLDEVDVFPHELLVVLEALSLVVLAGVDGLLYMTLFLAFDHAERLTA